MAQELYSNDASTTVALAADAPASGTGETWVVASSASFPAAATGVTQFHVADPGAPSEIILVTNVAGTSWSVTRGAESTTPVTHTAGYTVAQVLTWTESYFYRCRFLADIAEFNEFMSNLWELKKLEFIGSPANMV